MSPAIQPPFPLPNRLTCSAALALTLVAWSAVGAEPPKKPIDFAHDVVPILQKHCVSCHGGKESKGGFSLNTRRLLLEADVVVKGNARESRLWQLITSNDPDDQMPPRDRMRLKEAEIAMLARWLDGGIPWEDGFTFAIDRYEPPLRPRRPALPPAQPGRENPIDRIIDAYLAERQISPPAIAGDRVFIRRVYLDLIGLLPTPEQTQEFVADRRVDKRADLINELLSRPVDFLAAEPTQAKKHDRDEIDYRIAYAEHWLTFWNDLLRNDYGGTGFITGGRQQISDWLYRSLASNKPYDQFVRELIAPTSESEGFIKGIRWRGDVNSSQTVEIQFAQNVTQSFLGINMKCASCHDSFIDRWTLEETYNLAAVFSQRPLELHRCDKPLGVMAEPRWIFPEIGRLDGSASQPERLQQLADLMTHPENGRLTRTIVNRLWHRLMGRGIVHPVDAMHTEPWSADLLDFLASDLSDHGYDLKRTIALICSSQAYQSVTVPSPTDDQVYVYRGPLARRMTAEQFVDAIWTLTGTAPTKFDAPVQRHVEQPPEGDSAAERVAPSAVTARWIWSTRDARRAEAGEQRTFRYDFELNTVPSRALIAVTCDNEYRLLVNGRQVLADKDWQTVETADLRPHLQRGANQLLIVARNAGNSPNAAGMIAELRLLPEEANESHRPSRTTEMVIATGSTWEWTSAVPNRKGQLPGAKWQAAATVDHSEVWGEGIIREMQTKLRQRADSPNMMVRAALLKADTLMRALGRPNRDQIVTSRPRGLTTLEAIDLANGEQLYSALEAGGHVWRERGGDDPQNLVRQLFRAALCRDPSPAELSLAAKLLQNQPSDQAIADLLWAVVMLPEFQFVR